MCENKELLMYPDLYQKITILTSTLFDNDWDGYRVNHEFKEIIKQNNVQNNSCNIRTNYEKVDISKDLEQSESQIYYDCDRSSHESQFWKPICPKLENGRSSHESQNWKPTCPKLENGRSSHESQNWKPTCPKLEKLYEIVENGRYEIAKRDFES